METAKPVEKTMSNSDKNGHVKWRDFITAFLGMMVIIISLWSANVSYGEFTQFATGVDNRFGSFEKRFDAIEKRFDSIDIILKEIRGEIRDLRNIKK